MPDRRRPLPNDSIANILRGLTYPLEALAFISKHRLWSVTLVAVAINLLLLVLLAAAAFYFIVPWLENLDQWLMNAADAAWIEYLLRALSWLIWIVALLLTFAISALLLLTIGQTVAGPFLDSLSEKTEAIVLGREAPAGTIRGTLKSILLALSDVIKSLVFLVAVNVPILLVSILIPVAGAAIGAATSFAFSALLLAQEFMTTPLARQLVPYRKRFVQVWRNRWLALGFGVSAMGILLVPGLNIVLLPLAACGGTLAYCDLESAGRLS